MGDLTMTELLSTTASELLRKLEDARKGRAILGAEVIAFHQNARLLSVEQYGDHLYVALEHNSDGERYELRGLLNPTSNLVAALSLLPADWIWDVSSSGAVWVMPPDELDKQIIVSGITNPTIAVCIAAVRAHEQRRTGRSC